MPTLACPGSRTIPSLVSGDYERCYCDMCGVFLRTNTDGSVRQHAHNYERFLQTMAETVEKLTGRWAFGSVLGEDASELVR